MVNGMPSLLIRNARILTLAGPALVCTTATEVCLTGAPCTATATTTGAASPSRIASAIWMASAVFVLESTTANSSPPRRAT